MAGMGHVVKTKEIGVLGAPACRAARPIEEAEPSLSSKHRCGALGKTVESNQRLLLKRSRPARRPLREEASPREGFWDLCRSHLSVKQKLPRLHNRRETAGLFDPVARARQAPYSS